MISTYHRGLVEAAYSGDASEAILGVGHVYGLRRLAKVACPLPLVFCRKAINQLTPSIDPHIRSSSILRQRALRALRAGNNPPATDFTALFASRMVKENRAGTVVC
jgi:hypothetical protein